MDNELTRQYDDVPAIADDFLLSVADNAEKRIDAVIKIKNVALKVTNARDWTDQQGNPYLQASGSEKIANLFNISWRIEEPRCEDEADGHFTYSIKGIFKLGERTIEVEGTRSSKDPFFNRYDYSKPIDTETKKHPVLPPSTIDKGDVKKAALTNLYGNGITRMLGIRNLNWSELEKYAGITKDMVTSKVSYNQRENGGDRPPIQKPQEKVTTGVQTAGLNSQDIRGAVIAEPEGPYITEPQAKRFWAIAKASDRNDEQIHVWLKDRYGINSTSKIPRSIYDMVCTNVAVKDREPGAEG